MVKILKRVRLFFLGESGVWLLYINISDIKKVLKRKGKRKCFLNIINLDPIYFIL